MSKEIKVTEKEVKAAFDVAKSEETRAVLAALFCKPEDRKDRPNLDDYKSIRSYEDACEALGLTPYLSRECERAICEHEDAKGEAIPAHWDFRQNMPKHIIALLKLETISRALWGRNWEPKPDGEGSQTLWWPWFALWTKSEIANMDEEQKGALLSADAHTGTYAGFGFLATTTRSSSAIAYSGFRLCQETEKKAKYFGRQFKELWAEYYAFNFTVGGPIVEPK